MKIACLIAAVVFGLFAALQFNDAEQYGTRFWVGWVIAYGAIAGLSLYASQRSLPRSLYGTLSCLYAVAAMIRSMDISWDDAVLYNEANPAGNETGGLIVSALWLVFLAWRSPRSAGS